MKFFPRAFPLITARSFFSHSLERELTPPPGSSLLCFLSSRRSLILAFSSGRAVAGYKNLFSAPFTVTADNESPYFDLISILIFSSSL